LRNCLFIDLSRNTSATPMLATTRKPSTPAWTSLEAGALVALPALTTLARNVTGHTLPDTGE